MKKLGQQDPASGRHGIERRRTRSDKHGVGTAHLALSRVWFSIYEGILNEGYYPTIDQPQIPDLYYLITCRGTSFRDERQLDNTHKCVASGTLSCRITTVDPQKHFRIAREVIVDPLWLGEFHHNKRGSAQP